MKCLLKYQWVKLPRNQLPPGKGIMGSWARLASRAAFRTGQARYCGYTNKVSAGGWAGGIVGLKSILAIKRRRQALEHMDTLADLGYITYSLDTKTKKLTYQVTDWVVRCSGEPCMGREAVYATEGYGFLCLPRNVTQRLAERHYQFAEADAWLDLWCHTVWQESSNAFSFSAPAVQFGQYGAVLTLESLGRRWGWEKTKVWRFFRKHADAFPLYKLPGAFGCLIFNAVYPTGEQFTLPSQDKVERILREIRTKDGNTHENQQSDHARICKLVAWYSRAVLPREQEECRVASEDCYITRAYFSLGKILEYVREDCQGISPATPILNYSAEPCHGPGLRIRMMEVLKMADLKASLCGELPNQDSAIPQEQLRALLERRGIVGDPDIPNAKARLAEQELRRNMYHNTQVMLKHYRDIVWALECFPSEVAQELDQPLKDLDALLSVVDTQVALGNAKLEHRLLSIRKSRLLLDRINEALTVLRHKPGNGELMYNIIFQTFITPDKPSHTDILYRLDISERHYYRLRQQAVNILSIRLWTAPAGCLDAWLELLTLLEG